jgi:cytochrome c553
MEPVAGGLTEKLIRELAGYYAALEPSPESVENEAANGNDEDLLARGRQIAERGIPARRVPSCIDCHGPKGTKTKPAYPSLAGQYADYLELQLQLFKKDQRGGSEYAHLMHEVVHGLQPEDIRAVAHFFASIDRKDDTPARQRKPPDRISTPLDGRTGEAR